MFRSASIDQCFSVLVSRIHYPAYVSMPWHTHSLTHQTHRGPIVRISNMGWWTAEGLAFTRVFIVHQILDTWLLCMFGLINKTLASVHAEKSVGTWGLIEKRFCTAVRVCRGAVHLSGSLPPPWTWGTRVFVFSGLWVIQQSDEDEEIDAVSRWECTTLQRGQSTSFKKDIWEMKMKTCKKMDKAEAELKLYLPTCSPMFESILLSLMTKIKKSSRQAS